MTTSDTLQESKLMAEPQKEHHWLQRLVGEWTVEGEMKAEPGQPDWKSTGTESVRALGGLWIVAEGQGDWIVAEGQSEMPDGGPDMSLMTLGYDPRTGRFVSTWLSSMTTHLWVCDGWLDAAERVLTLEAEGPSMAGDGTMAKYRDVITLESADHRVLTAHVLGDDGQWQRFMTVHYRRK
jgi:hypothetical protein